ncbi:ABC transporter permease [Leifsonia poae]|uniref:ABC transporter permease n=1 Tax=Leifsonia poae TaxID=110933 RepID=UPI001CBDC10B|nr:ABC transporter permease subunit [Leifsonia poae]
MKTSLMFARKEAFEIVRTWRLFVLPAILLLFAVTGPLLARYTPQLLAAVAGDQFSALHVPEPTAFAAYGQWIKNLSQIGLFAIIIIYGGLVSAERRSGTAILVLTKPVSRSAFVVVKAIVHAVYVAVLLVVATLITWGLTAATFGDAPAGPLWSSALLWLVLAVLYVSLMTLFSVLIPSAAGAAGAGLGVFVLLSIGGIWTSVADYSPAGLLGRATSLAAGSATDSPLWPVLITLALSVLVVALAAALFRRKEL